ncbi:MAG: hypothetical protein IJS65_02580, partial [Clostridia bacterium]|nr:hypothetical protein [Clostridia bacterium]
ISINACRNASIGYTPDKLIYTGATVGGVSMGGVDVIKGGTSITYGEKTGEYFLSYKHANYAGNFYYVVLSKDSDFEAAKKCNMKKFIVSDDLLKDLNKSGKITDNKVLCVNNLTKADAQYVVNWLSGLA